MRGPQRGRESRDSVQPTCLPANIPLDQAAPYISGSGIKEVANVCNQSLMKLVTPEDDEPDEPKPVVQKQAEPNPDDSSAKQEGAASGKWSLPPAPHLPGRATGTQRL